MTIREIAAIAGVSPAAVSLVINNKKGVSAETRRHIQSIMEECGYVPAPVRRKADRFRDVIDEYYSFINNYPDSPKRQEADNILKIARKYVKE